jgi:hypothetical protein
MTSPYRGRRKATKEVMSRVVTAPPTVCTMFRSRRLITVLLIHAC